MSENDTAREADEAAAPAREDGSGDVEMRLVMALIGALAGFSLWLFVEKLDDLITSPRLYLFLFSFSAGLFAALLALAPMIGPARALVRAALLALPAAALLTWASLRFDGISQFMGTGHPILAFAILIFVPLPFLIAAARPDEGWRCYPALFLHAWNIVVRFAAALLFVGLFWGVIMLANALFQLIGLDLIEEILDIKPVPFVLTGTVLGLVLAVVGEYSTYVSPHLVLRLLRLFLPVVLIVMAVFVIALPLKGLDGIFGGVSVAATLLAMALTAITLVTIAADRDDGEAVRSGSMRLMARGLALLLPVLAVLAILAMAQRVRQYGWTPDRLAAATMAAIVLLYALSYALSVLRGRGWMARIRLINIALALLTLAIAALWLTPALDPQRISTESQIARFESGRADADTLDLLTMHNDWGRAGASGIERLKAMRDHPAHARLVARIGEFEEMGWQRPFDPFRKTLPPYEGRRTLERIAGRMPVRPDPDFDPFPVLEAMEENRLRLLDAACAAQTPRGNPACVLVHGDFLPASPGEEAIVIAFGLTFLEAGFRKAGEHYEQAKILILGNGLLLGKGEIEAFIDSIHEGDFAITQPEIRALDVKGRILIINP